MRWASLESVRIVFQDVGEAGSFADGFGRGALDGSSVGMRESSAARRAFRGRRNMANEELYRAVVFRLQVQLLWGLDFDFVFADLAFRLVGSGFAPQRPGTRIVRVRACNGSFFEAEVLLSSVDVCRACLRFPHPARIKEQMVCAMTEVCDARWRQVRRGRGAT